MSSEPGLNRVPDLWFSNADLILRAEDTIFRVFSAILGARSAVFRDMAAFPQPAIPEGEIIDGISVVRLHDSAAEVTVFLRAIFDSSFFMPPPSRSNFATVIGVLRLAHKYDVVYLFRRALSFLDQLYPHTFQKLVDNCAGSTYYRVDFPDDVETDLIVLRAASEVGALWLLPAAYYAICTQPAATLFAAGAPWNSLAISQQQNCLQAQVESTRATALVHGFLMSADLPLLDCEDGCAHVVSGARNILVSWSAAHMDLDPLGEWVFDSMDDELCTGCQDFAWAAHSAAQLAFWKRLPQIFGLPKWEELIEKRRAVMKDAV
ncbi:hypothetical protein C8R46DRAFT_1356164 [Mycena filopes]|nr:hypothetical protein C8R46DRAFT_1356164 [Mycena filopes]